MSTYLFYINYVYLARSQDGSEGFVLLNYICIAILGGFAAYFVKLEVNQL